MKLLVWCLLVCAFVAGCSQTLPRIEVPGFSVGNGLFAATAEGLTAAPITRGNAIRILLNGDEIFPAMVRAILGARQTVTYAEYFYEDGPVASDVSEALADKCKDGLSVNVLLDGFGTLNMPVEYRQRIEQAGCEVATYRPLTHFIFGRSNNRNHRRILVVDGRIGFVGGSGVSANWMGDGRTPGHWRDTDVQVEGPAVRYLQSAFVQNWLDATGEALGGASYFPRLDRRGDVSVQVVRSSPEEGSSAMYTMYVLAISSARRYIHVTNPYFAPGDAITNALLAAARRGVHVILLLPGAIDNSIVREASRRTWGRLLRGGVVIYQYRAALLHAKTMVFDDCWATIGSTNLDNRSFALNEELNVAMYGSNVAARLEQAFADDRTRSRLLTYEAWRHRGFMSRVLEWLALPLKPEL